MSCYEGIKNLALAGWRDRHLLGSDAKLQDHEVFQMVTGGFSLVAGGNELTRFFSKEGKDAWEMMKGLDKACPKDVNLLSKIFSPGIVSKLYYGTAAIKALNGDVYEDRTEGIAAMLGAVGAGLGCEALYKSATTKESLTKITQFISDNISSLAKTVNVENFNKLAAKIEGGNGKTKAALQAVKAAGFVATSILTFHAGEKATCGVLGIKTKDENAKKQIPPQQMAQRPFMSPYQA